MPFVETEAIVPIGKRLSYSLTSNGTFISVFGTTDITPPEREIGKAEYTNDDSPNKTKQYKPSLTEPGMAKATYKYQVAQYATLDAIFIAGTTAYWKIQTPDLKTRTFQGFMTKHAEDTLSLEEVPDINIEIQVSGPVTLGTGT